MKSVQSTSGTIFLWLFLLGGHGPPVHPLYGVTTLACPPMGPNFLIFMHFLGEIG